MADYQDSWVHKPGRHGLDMRGEIHASHTCSPWGHTRNGSVMTGRDWWVTPGRAANLGGPLCPWRLSRIISFNFHNHPAR